MRVLIVEDEHRIANTIKKGLVQERFAVDVAYDGVMGLDLASSEEYDIIILDLMLPGSDGLTVCKKLRKRGNHVPILILTAKGLVGDKVVGLDMGADDYLTKPFSFEELLARIRALTRRPKKSLGSIIHVRDFALDSQHYAAKRGEVSVVFTHKEFSLVEFLMRNAGNVITKDQIIAHIWDYDADILPNTVEVYIRNIRKKIDEPFADKTPLIQTVRGFGYKIG